MQSAPPCAIAYLGFVTVCLFVRFKSSFYRCQAWNFRETFRIFLETQRPPIVVKQHLGIFTRRRRRFASETCFKLFLYIVLFDVDDVYIYIYYDNGFVMMLFLHLYEMPCVTCLK